VRGLGLKGTYQVHVQQAKINLNLSHVCPRVP